MELQYHTSIQDRYKMFPEKSYLFSDLGHVLCPSARASGPPVLVSARTSVVTGLSSMQD